MIDDLSTSLQPPGLNLRAERRWFDLGVAVLALVALSPLFALIALLIMLDSPGPVLYRGLRAGKHGMPFYIFKFRTMIAGAARRGSGITTRNDPRITRVGRWLRRSKLDELPQLLNVVRGEMTLVGPRPEDPWYVERYSLQQRQVLQVPPGITGPASVAFRHEERMLAGADWQSIYLNRVMPRKLALELDYLHHRTFRSDLRLIVETVLSLFREEPYGQEIDG